jgi:hypothetical protein
MEAGDEPQPRIGRDGLNHLPAHAAERAGDGYLERIGHLWLRLENASPNNGIETDPARTIQAGGRSQTLLS